ncbi:MAG: hypothetical protein RLZZ494_1231 [Pseudomonadota bacterium]|jgi:hypothetical protein
MSARSALFSTLLALGVAVVLTAASSVVERIGPEQVSYSNLCGPTGSGECLEPVLAGGFPLAYLIDAPGISVEHQLSFGEDTIRPGPMLLNLCFYWAAGLLVLRWFRHRCPSTRPRAPNREDPPGV